MGKVKFKNDIEMSVDTSLIQTKEKEEKNPFSLNDTQQKIVIGLGIILIILVIIIIIKRR